MHRPHYPRTPLCLLLVKANRRPKRKPRRGLVYANYYSESFPAFQDVLAKSWALSFFNRGLLPCLRALFRAGHKTSAAAWGAKAKRPPSTVSFFSFEMPLLLHAKSRLRRKSLRSLSPLRLKLVSLAAPVSWIDSPSRASPLYSARTRERGLRRRASGSLSSARSK